jgi:hypothetical protein
LFLSWQQQQSFSLSPGEWNLFPFHRASFDVTAVTSHTSHYTLNTYHYYHYYYYVTTNTHFPPLGNWDVCAISFSCRLETRRKKVSLVLMPAEFCFYFTFGILFRFQNRRKIKWTQVCTCVLPRPGTYVVCFCFCCLPKVLSGRK